MTTYYVSATNGNDNNPGTSNSPFKTIYKGIQTCNNGDTVQVLPGIYYPTFSTRPIVNKSINLLGSGKNNTIIDGIKISSWTTDWNQGLVEIRIPSTTSNIINTFSGFTVRNVNQNYQGSNLKQGAGGICLVGANNVIIEHNKIQNIWSSGLEIHAASNNVIARYNDIDHCCSWGDPTKPRIEDISINKASNFQIYYNYIHSSGHTSTGIISRGGEGIDAYEGSSNGKIHHNYLYDIRNVGIYLDAFGNYCQDIEVYDNIAEKIYNTSTVLGVGIGISAEIGGTSQRLNFHDNITYNNRIGFNLPLWHVANKPSGIFSNIVYNNNINYTDSDKDIKIQGAPTPCVGTLNNILIENNFAHNIFVDPCYHSATTLSGNITDMAKIVNAFNAKYGTLKNDILSHI